AAIVKVAVDANGVGSAACRGSVKGLAVDQVGHQVFLVNDLLQGNGAQVEVVRGSDGNLPVGIGNAQAFQDVGKQHPGGLVRDLLAAGGVGILAGGLAQRF